ncbi:MAG TPA: radical SAM protein, partial [Verrucomicrobiae bacterium]|nr:radical SAM protein [Verrucomicrobiae bacterium]
RKLKLTRRCLEVLAEFRNPVAIITKNFLVTRDIDVLSELAKFNAVSVCLSVTTLDTDLRKVMEPRTSPPIARLAAIRKLSEAGIPVSVNVAPIIPGLTDHEIPKILKAAREAGAVSAGFTVVRLPYAIAPLFEKWLAAHFPDRREKVLNRIKAMRGGKLYDAQWGKRFRGEGIFAEQIAAMFDVARRKAGFPDDFPELSTAHFRRPGGAQLSLFS